MISLKAACQLRVTNWQLELPVSLVQTPGTLAQSSGTDVNGLEVAYVFANTGLLDEYDACLYSKLIGHSLSSTPHYQDAG